MSNPLPLSVFMIANNEADRIARAIASVKGWVDEIIVVVNDTCADDTVNVAQAAGADIVQTHAWTGYGPQKIVAQNLCRNRWLFNLDADEEVTPALRAQIEQLFAQTHPIAPAYRVDAVQVFPGELTPRSFSPHLEVVRIFDRERAGFRDSPVHDSVILKSDGQVPHDAPLLTAPLNHFSFRNLSHMIEKMNQYSTMQAEDMVARGKKVSRARLISEPFTAYAKYYLLRRYYTMGPMGVVYAMIYACWRTLRLAKAWEMQKGL